MNYKRINIIIKLAKTTESKEELIKVLGEDTAFRYGKNLEKILIEPQRKRYIKKCIELGLLDDNYKLTSLGSTALKKFNETLSNIILNQEIDGKKFKTILLQAISEIKIPTVEEIKEKFNKLTVNITISELRSQLNFLSKCGILQKNRKYTYNFKNIGQNDFENIIRSEYNKAEKDPTGLIWFEAFKKHILKKFMLTLEEFDKLFSQLRKDKPSLIGTQRSRSKTWLLIRE